MFQFLNYFDNKISLKTFLFNFNLRKFCKLHAFATHVLALLHSMKNPVMLFWPETIFASFYIDVVKRSFRLRLLNAQLDSCA